MSLIDLNARDFSRVRGHNGELLILNMKGSVLVMYTSDSCSICHNFLPIFSRYPQRIRGCNFAIANCSKNNQAIQIACMNTNIALSSVPHFVLFVDGVPIAESDSRQNVRDTADWIRTNLESYYAQQAQQNQQAPPQQQSRRPPPQQQSQQQYDDYYEEEQQAPTQRRRPPQSGGGGRPPQSRRKGVTYSDETGVRIFKTSYGIPYNAVNAEEFEKYEDAYEEHLYG